MSASGKTTIANEAIKLLRQSNKTWVLIDGDCVRTIMGEDLGHTIEDRRKNAHRISRLCAFLDSQGINVLACVLSIFYETQDWLRENIPDYRQIYLKVDYTVLKKRDNKQLYELAESGKITDVVGVQIPFPEPKNSDFILENNIDGIPSIELAKKALNGLGISESAIYKYSKKDLLSNPITYQYSNFEGKEFLSAYRISREEALFDILDKINGYLKHFVYIKAKTPEKHLRLSNFLLKPIIDINFISSEEELAPLLAHELLPYDYRRRFILRPEVVDVDTVITREYLVTELLEVMDNTWNYTERHAKVLKLLQRFEVSKRIHISYSKTDMKKSSDDFSDIYNYELFHCLLTSIHRYIDPLASLVIENAMLKLGDILVSIIPRLTTGGQMLLGASLITNELKIMKDKYNV